MTVPVGGKSIALAVGIECCLALKDERKFQKGPALISQRPASWMSRA
jgi:hypothetical protein